MRKRLLDLILSAKTRLGLLGLAAFACTLFALGSTIHYLGNIEQLLALELPQHARESGTDPQTLRNLSRVFADTDFLLTTFVKREEFLKSERKRLQEQMEILRAGLPKSALRASLEEFARQAQIVLGYCAGINESIRRIEKIDTRLKDKLQGLQRNIADRIMEQVQAGRDTAAMTQFADMAAGFKETVLEINLAFSRSGLGFPAEDNTQAAADIRNSIKGLHLRLRALGAAPPEIASLGREIAAEVQNLGGEIDRFNATLAELQRARSDLSTIRGGSLEEMKKIDDNLALSSLGVQDRIQQIINRARVYFQYLIVIVLALCVGLTVAVVRASVQAPLQGLKGALDALRDGKYQVRVNLSGGSEWKDIAKAINEMAEELDEARRDLEQRNRALEAGNAKLQRRIETLEDELKKAKT